MSVATVGQHTEMDGEVVVEALGFNQDVGFVGEVGGVDKLKIKNEE